MGWYVKCLQYDNHDIGFKVACFIMTNISRNELYKKIKDIIDDSIHFNGDGGVKHNISEVADKITIFSYKEGKDKQPEVSRFLLDDVFKEKNKEYNQRQEEL